MPSRSCLRWKAKATIRGGEVVSGRRRRLARLFGVEHSKHASGRPLTWPSAWMKMAATRSRKLHGNDRDQETASSDQTPPHSPLESHLVSLCFTKALRRGLKRDRETLEAERRVFGPEHPENRDHVELCGRHALSGKTYIPDARNSRRGADGSPPRSRSRISGHASRNGVVGS